MGSISTYCEKGFGHVREAFQKAVLSPAARTAWVDSMAKKASLRKSFNKKSADAAGAAAVPANAATTTTTTAAASAANVDVQKQAAPSNPAAAAPSAAKADGNPPAAVGPTEHKLSAEELANARLGSMSVQERNRRRSANIAEAGVPQAHYPKDLTSQPWFRSVPHTPTMVRDELEASPLGTFILCPRPLADAYTIHVCEIGKIKAFDLDPELSAEDTFSYRLPGGKLTFPTVAALIAYYGSHSYGTDNTGCPLFLKLGNMTTVR